MLEFSWFICGLLYFFVGYYLFTKLSDKEFIINKKSIILSLIMGLLNLFLFNNNIIYLRPYFIFVYMILSLKIITDAAIVKTILGIVFVILSFSMAEIIFGAICIFVFKINVSILNYNWFSYFITNTLILLISLLILYFKSIKKLFKNIISWYNENEFKSLVIFIIFFIIVVSFFLYNNLISILPKSFLWIINLFSLGVLIFVIGFFKEKSNNNRIITEYDHLLNYVKVYEKTIEEKSKNQHEYKNQLILIKSMIKNNKKLCQYIDNIICDAKDDDNLELLRKLQYLPQGGLKGLIYYKCEEMLEKNIDVYINISPLMNKPKITKTINNNLYALSKIIGVYLDNAIEAVESAQNKYIVLEACVEKNDIVFIFSNTYKGQINLSKIDKEGYTTKGKGKGYGLSLVKDIINNSPIFNQEREVNGQYYVQKLYIKNKS